MTTARELMAMAGRAAASATLPLDAGDADGVCNRACYAMYDAARAALLAAGPVANSVSAAHP